MAQNEQVKHGSVLPPGLVNLGNTCYMNATLQCLKVVPELRNALASSSIDSSDGGLTLALRNLYAQMDDKQEHVTPTTFVGTLRRVLPQFAEMGRGGFKQQDADEFYNELFAILARSIPKTGNEAMCGNAANVIDALFGIDVTVELKCNESIDEPVVTKQDSFRRLQCTITQDVQHLSDGISEGFKGELEKRSDLSWSQRCVGNQKTNLTAS